MEPIYIAGIAMTQFGRHPERSLQNLALEALQGALADANAQRSDIGAVFYAGITNGPLQGQFSIPGQVVCSKIGIEGVPVYNVENACASGSTAVHLAVQSLRAGATDVALALGVEKMNVADKLKALSLFETGWDVSTAEENYEILVKMGEGIVPPAGSESDRPYSKFMAIYAAMCRWHMKTYGTTQRQIAAVCAKNHQHSVHNPYSQFRKTFSIEEVLAAPPITYPITLPMCAPLSDGAAAAILCTEAGLKRIGADPKRCVRIAASVIRSFTLRDLSEPEKHVSLLAARQAYEIAGLGPQDMHVAEVHDASAMGEIIQSENLGLAPLGQGGVCAERGDFTVGGRIPINPSGGLESKGHPLGATGIGQLYELTTQLRGEAGARQVEGARHAIQENGGGLLGVEEAAVAIHILSR
ncbi:MULTISPECIES: thiolase family protein [Pseudomonas]|jgi:acetyl-CoA acetyltransferase|uniref:Thiolase domain protein n=1 Tax=Pseudomonas chlororaphis O6 TaxID=1037915 RepID=A0AB33WPS7_9PSED|nr:MULTISPECIES: thiolase family protein [Pseudomonas]AZD73446.1 3-ketoacyl-CoA thiolase [Pseudomonas chlororaphis subsp. aurantiaca]AZE11448.1 3-ketoacyl-CoA thiolase [Pseudomonas chlororaphis subsp. aureofaciens]AZE17484.1 3-ketoacyl-CoA thiolase [Pseudomonas chlororaphis subsp. aureofaciens]EIM15005.1 thiolase domain protein [Pseudomonas chlororaphis O6]POA65834.1 thiolase family protein [Pseudomonas sp. GW531-T4]